jgi:hypothetical protein
MALKIKLGKAEHDALEESLKSLYVPDGDDFKLDADYEDVSGLKAKRDELLGKVSELTKAVKAFEGLDPEAAREALRKKTEQEEQEMTAVQKLKKRTEEWEAERKTFTDRIAALTSTQAQKELAMKLAQNGVKPNLADDLALSLTTREIQYAEENGAIVWKTKDGLESVDLDKYIPGLKENGKADYFATSLKQGTSTPPGSQNGGGGHDYSKLSAEDKIAAGFAAKQ